jgi:hypothetical protein
MDLGIITQKKRTRADAEGPYQLMPMTTATCPAGAIWGEDGVFSFTPTLIGGPTRAPVTTSPSSRILDHHVTPTASSLPVVVYRAETKRPSNTTHISQLCNSEQLGASGPGASSSVSYQRAYGGPLAVLHSSRRQETEKQRKKEDRKMSDDLVRTFKPSRQLLYGSALADALEMYPELTLAEYNRAGATVLHKEDLIILRTPCTPSAGSVLNSATLTAPFSTTRNLGTRLEPVLGVQDLYLYLRADMTELRESGNAPIPVKVQLAVPRYEEGDDSDHASAFVVKEFKMLFVPDGSIVSSTTTASGHSGGPGGWVISPSRWEGRLHGGARRWRREA